MSKIYKYKGEDISEEFVTEGFEQSSFTILDDYIANTDGLEVIEEVEDFQNGTVGTDAPVVPATPSRASIIAGVEPESMELEQVDTSLELEDPEPKRIGRAQVRQEELQRRKIAEEQKKIENTINEISFSNNVFNNLPDNEKIKLQDIAVDQIVLDYKSQGIQDYEITPEEIYIKSDEILKEKNRPSVVKSYAAQAVKGFASFAKGVSEMGDTIKYSLVESALDAFNPDYKGTVEEKQAIMNVVKSGALEAPGTAILPPSSEIGKFIEKLEPSIRKYESNTITEDIEKGNYLQAGERAVGAAIESLPSLVAAATGVGGLVLLGGSVSGGKFMEEFEADPEKSTGVLLANAGLTGVTEASFELVTRGILSKARLLKNSGADKAAADLIRGGSEKLITSLGLNTLAEGGSEAATKVTTLFLDQLTLDRDIDWGKEAYNIIDEGIVGGIMGSGTTFAGSIANSDKAIVERAQMILTPSENKQQLIKSANNISKLYTDAKLADAEGVKLINEAIKSEENNIVEIKKETAEALNNMTPAELKIYAGNQNELRKLQQQIQNPKTTESVRQLANIKFVEIRNENDVLFKESGKRKIQRGVDIVTKAAEKLEGVEVQSFDTTQEVKDFIKQQDPEADIKASEQQGFIIQDPKSGEQTIVINKEVAGKEKAMNIAGHEFGHAILFKTVKENPETAVNLGNALLSEINKIDAAQVKDSKFKKRLEQYSTDPESIKMEEAITLFSDALSTGDIKFNENVFTKIGDQIRRIMQSLGVKIKFNTGRDVYNFVKDYNKSIEKGKISKAQIKAAKEGIKGALVKDIIKDTEAIIKESRSEESSQEVQRIYEEQGEAGAFDIIEQFKPIVNKIVEQRSQAPNFDRQLLTDEIETGKRGIFDLIREYKPESGVPLAAYINKFLPARAIEASKRVLGEEFTEDVTEARGVVAEATPAEVVEERVTRKIKPTSLIPVESVTKIKEQVTEKIKEIPADKLTFKKLGDLAPEVIAEAIGIPVKKLVDPKANLSKGDASAIQRFVNKNADRLLKLLPEGAVLEAATEKLIGTSTGVPKGLLNAFYTKQERIGKGAGLAPFKKNPNITKADFLKAFGIVEGKKAEDFSARSPEAQALKGIANLYGRLVTNEIARTETDLDIETKQDIAAGKARLMFSKSSEKLLNKHGLDYTPIRSKADVDNYINNMVKPLINIFNSEDYKLLNRTVLQFRSKALGKRKEVSDYLRNELTKLNLPSRVTVGRTKPTKAIGSTVEQFQKSQKSGKLQEYNVKNGIVFDKMWNDINEAVSKDKNMAIPIMYFLENSINESTNPHRMGAPIIGYQFNAGKLYYEHAVQSQLAYITLMDAILDSNKDFNTEFQKIKDNYKIIAISKTNNDKLNEAGFGLKMPEGWNNWYDRYFNEKVSKIRGGINPETLIDTNTGELFSEMFDVDAAGKKPSKDIKLSKASKLDKTFNDILEKKSGIPSRKRYGVVEAITKGASKGKFNFFIPPSAEDFVGLLYPTLAKGEVGDAQMSWYKKNLIDPYAEAMNKLSKARVFLMNNYNLLKSQLGIVPKNLSKKIEGTDYTREQAIRVYIWNKQKMNIPGISDKDISQLSNYVADDTNLQAFADQLINMQLGDGYIKPKEGWPAGTITTDILEGLNTTKRAKYLNKWQENVDAIFSEENLNKLQAIYGLNYRKALENMLKRMKSGRNRSFPGDSLTGRFTDWLTGSVGAIMFFNTRSAILQTISSINFINFTDNNILAAGKAFANQKQYWSDFMKLINSDFLKERRGGLRINVNEADIADMAKKGGVKGAISKLLELGFAPTQIADSFAIASGGATFYRNRIKTYKKQGLSDKQAEKKAFEDFRETAEESQQSSRADRISMQQAGPLGRVILAFANTPAQYARIIKKAASDLKNGRGDAKTNISKIIYYGAVQNLIFNALQQALFAIGFGDEEPKDEEKQKKYINIANGMLDSLLRGAGIGGAIVSVGKNAIIKLAKELEKDRPKLQNIASEVIKISPPVSAKYSRLVQAGKSYDWNKEEMKEKGLSLDNPAYLAGANVVSALTNIPLDRVIKKANNVVSATSQDLETWERLALLGGWQDWEIGIEKENKSNKPQPRKVIKKKVVRKKLAK